MPPRLGIVGAGQLARMTYTAAVELGLTPAVLADRADDAAARIAADVTVAGDLAAFAAGCDVVTFDYEIVEPDALARADAAGATLRPSPDALRFAQDKQHQRHALG